MKKYQKLVVFTIVLCAISALNVKVMLDTDRTSDLMITSLAAMGEGGSGEGGGSGESGGSNKPCSTSTIGDVSLQDCRGVQQYARVTITLKCEGQELGLCQDGVEYYFYDCEGAMIKHDQYITSKSCQ